MPSRSCTSSAVTYVPSQWRGVRVYSIGMKSASGEWAFRYSCSITDRAQIAELRSKAITQAAQIARGKPSEGTVEALIDAWFKWQ